MKTHVLLRKGLPVAILAALLSLASASGQDKTTASTQKPGERPDAVSAKKFNLEVSNDFFSGGQLESGQHRKPATIGNIVAYLREQDPGLNLVLSPGVADVQVKDLKLHSADMRSVIWALSIATGGAVGETEGSGPGHWALTSRERPGSAREVEAFNLSGYFQQLGAQDEKELLSNLDEVEHIIADTFQMVGQNNASHGAQPVFQFHRGANLLIVIGSPEAIEVARKVVNALPGQSGPGVPGFAITPIPDSSRRMSKGQRAIAAKLENIRLESVLYDGLPLAEVVRNLIDESKKRDPEKQGINFLVNPNQPLSSTPTPTVDPATGQAAPPPSPQESVDINSVTIKINPGLANVRLVDVLDAIVRVADHPIKYTVTDYSVVFSLAGNEGPIGGGPLPGIPPVPKPAR